MRISTIQVTGLKSVQGTQPLELGPITLFVGRNNTGKSTILRAIYSIQLGGQLAQRDVRYGHPFAQVDIRFSNPDMKRFWGIEGTPNEPDARLQMQINADGANQNSSLQTNSRTVGVSPISNVAPRNFIYPFLAGRKVGGYEEQISRNQALAVDPSLHNLVAKVDFLMDRQHTQHQTFIDLLDRVVGLKLSAIHSENGKRIGQWVNRTDAIYLEDMGDGVAQLLGLIVNLCLAEGQVFLIEELENDVHPEALKVLLAVIEERRHENQFIDSTHNNIVLRTLGSLVDSKIYEVTSQDLVIDGLRLPTSAINLVGPSKEERIRLLTHLGYDLSDLDLWDGWMILEESSAERIIRDHLIRWFVPSLSRVRPVAANGTSDVERTFNALYKLVLFTHLEERYRGRVLVILDGDESGLATTDKLHQRFSSWPRSAFQNFEQADFERYYPPRFAAKANAALSLTRQAKRNAKRELLQEVLLWIDDDDHLARAEFEESAKEVVGKLVEFERGLGSAADII